MRIFLSRIQSRFLMSFKPHQRWVCRFIDPHDKSEPFLDSQESQPDMQNYLGMNLSHGVIMETMEALYLPTEAAVNLDNLLAVRS